MGKENVDDRILIIESISAVRAVDSVEFEQMVSDQMAEIGAVKNADELRAPLDSLRRAGDRVTLFVARLGPDLVGFTLLNVCFGLESGGGNTTARVVVGDLHTFIPPAMVSVKCSFQGLAFRCHRFVLSIADPGRRLFMAKRSTKGSGKPIPTVEIEREVSPERRKELLRILQTRFGTCRSSESSIPKRRAG